MLDGENLITLYYKLHKYVSDTQKYQWIKSLILFKSEDACLLMNIYKSLHFSLTIYESIYSLKSPII